MLFQILPWAFTKIVWCMVHEWRRQGVFMMLYLNDFCMMARTRSKLLPVQDEMIGPLLDRLGWQHEPTKGCWEPMQEAEVLGLIVDLKQGQF